MRVLRIEGAVTAGEEDYEVQLDDWIVRPLAVQLLHATIPRWQWWRGARGGLESITGAAAR
jgi:hypothetical protein